MSYDDKYIEEIREILRKSNNTYLNKLVEKLIDERRSLKEIVKAVAPQRLTAPEVKPAQPKAAVNEPKYSAVLLTELEDAASIKGPLGDKFLKLLYEKLKNIKGSQDLLFKYEGYKHSVVFNDAGIDDVKKRIDFLENELEKFRNTFGVTFSVRYGISKYEEGKTLKEAMKEANEALSDVKEESSNKVYVYTKK